MKLKTIYSKFLSKYYNLKLGIHAMINGVQLSPSHLKWMRIHEKNRNVDFVLNGYSNFILLDQKDWKNFSMEVGNYFNSFGETNESKVDWALNKRLYLNIENTKNIKDFIEKLILSDTFKSKIQNILGTKNWEIFSTQIWRNYPEDFSNANKEINSSFYHVDNGGDKDNRLLVNVFMYLSPISEENGPFTFYDKKTSNLINKHFFKHIIKYGNLRKFFLTKEIENLYKPKILLESNGASIIINNQECLHRAGFCLKDCRDILEIIVKPVINLN